jgi:hypothetical protein
VIACVDERETINKKERKDDEIVLCWLGLPAGLIVGCCSVGDG